jgi:hypothetical protein
MSEPGEEERIVWSIEHRTHVFWFEKGAAAAAFVVGSIFAYVFKDTGGFGLYASFILMSAGVVGMVPSLKPLYSKIIDRIPSLPSSKEGTK